MPANKKYLTQSALQRTLKLTAGVIGGYFLTLALHQFVMLFLPKKDVHMTMHFTTYIIWAVLMVVAFLAKSGWRIWGWYLFGSIVLLAPFWYQMIVK